MEVEKKMTTEDYLKLDTDVLDEIIVESRVIENPDKIQDGEMPDYTYEDPDEIDEVVEDEDTLDEVSDEEEILESTDDEDEDNSNVDDEEESEEEVSEDVQEYINDILKGKKAKIKWNKVETEIDAEQLIELSQKGIDYDIKKEKLKEAKDTYDKLKAAGIEENDIEAFIKLKENGENALKDFIALQGMDIDKLRDDVYEFDQADVDERKTYYEDIKANYNPVDAVIDTVTEETNNKFIELADTIPGLENFTSKVAASGNDKMFSLIIEAVDNGSFDRTKDAILNKFINMPDTDKRKMYSDENFFLEVYNEVANQPQTNVQPTAEPAIPAEQNDIKPDVESKKAFGKSKPKKINAKQKTKNTVESYIQNYTAEQLDELIEKERRK